MKSNSLARPGAHTASSPPVLPSGLGRLNWFSARGLHFPRPTRSAEGHGPVHRQGQLQAGLCSWTRRDQVRGFHGPEWGPPTHLDQACCRVPPLLEVLLPMLLLDFQGEARAQNALQGVRVRQCPAPAPHSLAPWALPPTSAAPGPCDTRLGEAFGFGVKDPSVCRGVAVPTRNTSGPTG